MSGELSKKQDPNPPVLRKHNRVPPGQPRGCSTPLPQPSCPQQWVSPSLPAHTSTGQWLVSGVREPVLLSKSFGPFFRRGGYCQQKAQAAGPAAVRRRRRKVGTGDHHPRCPLGITTNYLAAELAPRQAERLCCPSPHSCSCCLRHHNPSSCQTGLQEQFPHFAPCWWLCALLTAWQPPSQEMQTQLSLVSTMLLCLLLPLCLATLPPCAGWLRLSFPLPKSTRLQRHAQPSPGAVSPPQPRSNRQVGNK